MTRIEDHIVDATSDVIQKSCDSQNPCTEYSTNEKDANVCYNESNSMKKQLRKNNIIDIKTLL